MAAAIAWYGYDGASLNSLASSGVGFYGDDGFGAPILVGEWNGRSFKTNSTGTVESTELWNSKYISATGVILGQSGSGILLKQVPNSQSLINLRFTNDSAVRVQNGTLTIYDRSDPDNPASGITTAVYEVVHTGVTQTPDGSGGPGTPTGVGGVHQWYMFPADTVTGAMPISDSPGTSGLSPSGASTTDTRHDWYFILSCSPDSIGSKLFGAYTIMEYL